MLRVTTATSLSPAQPLTLETQLKERHVHKNYLPQPLLSYTFMMCSSKNHEVFEKARKSNIFLYALGSFLAVTAIEY